MAGNYGATKYYVTTVWTIQNLSCWNPQLHGDVIKNSPGSTQISIYPNGDSGKDGGEFMVRITPLKISSRIFGKLTIRNSTRVLYCQPIQFYYSRQFDVPIGRTFKEVIHPVGSNYDDYHPGKITLECRIENDKEELYCMQTEILVFDPSLEIPAALFEKCDLLLPVCISTIEYPQDYDRMDSMSLTLSQDNSKISFALQPKFVNRTFVSVTIENNAILIAKNSHLFQNRNAWVFSSSLSRADFKKYRTLRFNIIIVPCHECLRDPDHRSFNRRVSVQIFPTTTSTQHDSKVPGTGFSEVSLVQPSNSVDVFSKDFSRLYQDHDFSDFQLRCGDVTFPVHRAILSARSPVFKTMLSCDMTEAATGAVDITDLDAPTVDIFLSHLYAGTDIDDLQGDSALKLYYAADKYQVSSLKAKCASVLAADVSIEDVCDILSLAEKHQDEFLSSVAKDFVSRNYNETLCSEKWKSFMESQPLLAVKTLTDIAEKNVVKSDVQGQSPSPKKPKIIDSFCM